jgi:hypothetical protein
MKKKYTDIKKGSEGVSFTGKEIQIQDREGKNIVIALIDRRESEKEH